MGKKIKMEAIGCIQLDKTTYQPGDPFSCEANEAERLAGLNVAKLADAVAAAAGESMAGSAAASIAAQLADIAAATSFDEINLIAIGPDVAPEVLQAAHERSVELVAQAHTELVAKISAAASEEEILALLPQEEPGDQTQAEELSSAACARMTELGLE